MLILYSKFCLGKFFINLIKNSLLIIVKVIVDVSTTLSTELINQIFLINFKLVFNLYILSVSKKSLKPLFNVVQIRNTFQKLYVKFNCKKPVNNIKSLNKSFCFYHIRTNFKCNEVFYENFCVLRLN